MVISQFINWWNAIRDQTRFFFSSKNDEILLIFYNVVLNLMKPLEIKITIFFYQKYDFV